MKKVVVTQHGGVAILSGPNVNIEVTDNKGRVQAQVEKIVEDKDLKHIDKIKKDSLKEIS